MTTLRTGLLTAGDGNGDGLVNGTDLAAWQQNYDPLMANHNTTAMGDFNEDGKIDGSDLALWQISYSPLGAAGGMETIPEPATLFLLGTGVLSALGFIHRRRLP